MADHKKLTRRGSAPASPPLSTTNPRLGASRLRARLEALEALAPREYKDPRFDAVEQSIQSTVLAIFGDPSPEYEAYRYFRIFHTEMPDYLVDDPTYHVRRGIDGRTNGLQHTKVKLEYLIKQLEELAEEHGQEGSMSSPLAGLANEMITLVKPDGSQHKAKASVQPGKIFVFDTRFPVAAGDEIAHVPPSGVEQRFEVLDPGFIGAPGGMSHYEIKVRNKATPRRAPAPSVVHTHHYNNSGIANVMGPDGVASGNTNSMQITHQTLNLGDPRIADELAEIRKALATETDDDAAIEAGHVASAQKALKAGDEGGFRAAMKRLGAKAWGVAEKLGLAWMTTEGRDLLGLPPG